MINFIPGGLSFQLPYGARAPKRLHAQGAKPRAGALAHDRRITLPDFSNVSIRFPCLRDLSPDRSGFSRAIVDAVLSMPDETTIQDKQRCRCGTAIGQLSAASFAFSRVKRSKTTVADRQTDHITVASSNLYPERNTVKHARVCPSLNRIVVNSLALWPDWSVLCPIAARFFFDGGLTTLIAHRKKWKTR
jgi:hypothetical protein